MTECEEKLFPIILVHFSVFVFSFSELNFAPFFAKFRNVVLKYTL